MLACIIPLMYLSARKKYKIVQKMPTKIGFTDLIFYPNDKNKNKPILKQCA